MSGQDEVPRRLAREYYAEMMEMRRRALAAEEECREAEREISELMAAKKREEAEARRSVWRSGEGLSLLDFGGRHERLLA